MHDRYQTAPNSEVACRTVRAARLADAADSERLCAALRAEDHRPRASSSLSTRLHDAPARTAGDSLARARAIQDAPVHAWQPAHLRTSVVALSRSSVSRDMAV